MRLTCCARNAMAVLQHPLKMLTYYLYAPLFSGHCALPSRPWLCRTKLYWGYDELKH